MNLAQAIEAVAVALGYTYANGHATRTGWDISWSQTNGVFQIVSNGTAIYENMTESNFGRTYVSTLLDCVFTEAQAPSNPPSP